MGRDIRFRLPHASACGRGVCVVVETWTYESNV